MQWWILGGGLVAIAVMNAAPWLFGKASAGIASLGTGMTAKSGTVPSRREVLDDLDAAFAFFDSVGCKEGMDAIKIAVGHAFEHKEVEAKA